jgi:hypothetical protein
LIGTRLVNADTSVLRPTERRQWFRLGITIPALIDTGAGIPFCPCTVLDVAQGGGRIRLEADAVVPDHFDLLFTKEGTVRRSCSVIWRRDDYLGVAFSARFDNA